MTRFFPGSSHTRRGTSARRRATAASAAALAAVLTVSACGSSGGSGTSSSGSPAGSGSSGSTKKVGVSLILKTLTNPYFVAMSDDAKAAAAKNNVDLTVAAGSQDGDTAAQITAIQNARSRGDKGILITTNGDAVNAALKQAKAAGIYVIALDTATNPADVADITYGTDNTEAGRLDGEYAAAKLGGKKAVIAMLDLFDNQVVSVDINRDHGFLMGMGIEPGSTDQNGKEAKTGTYKGGGQYEIVCHNATQGAIAGGRTAMENCLSANPNVNVVYSINEPAGQGAYDALKAARKTDVADIYTIDGSCKGIGLVKTGEFTADTVQFPGKMAAMGVDAIATLARTGKKPTTTGNKDFFDTGTGLVATKEVSGVKATSPDQAITQCWGTKSGG